MRLPILECEETRRMGEGALSTFALTSTYDLWHMPEMFKICSGLYTEKSPTAVDHCDDLCRRAWCINIDNVDSCTPCTQYKASWHCLSSSELVRVVPSAEHLLRSSALDMM